MTQLKWLIIILLAVHFYYHNYIVLWVIAFSGITLAAVITYFSIKKIWNS